MKKLMIASIASLCLCGAANANCTSQTIGGFTYTNCDDGSQYQSQQLGQFNYVQGQDAYGNRAYGVQQDLGGFTYSNGPLFNGGR
jgi:hypothetical protein